MLAWAGCVEPGEGEAMAKVILITGASAGIGRACADRLHDGGWTVVGASRRGSSSGGWTPMVMDVDSDESVSKGVATILGEHSRLDAVVACAGWGLAGAVELTPMAEAKDQLETNFWGAVRVVQEALPIMRRQGDGRVVLVSSIGGVIGIPFQAFYSASKFAMEGYGEALAHEVAPFGIHVTLVEPGNVRTDFTRSRREVESPAGEDTYREAVAKAVGLMERDEANGVEPGDVALAVEKVLGASRPRRRVSVGKIDERIGIIGKRLLPYRLFERAAKSSLGV
jgi:NAD(P)-dependent dehydrogenase (short-subunit alcohol dehydrogenase family)